MANWPALVEHHVDDCLARGLSPRTVDGKRSALQAFARWCASEGLTDPASFTLAELERYRRFTHEAAAGRYGKLLDIASQRNRLTAVRVFLRRLARQRLIPSDPGAEFELPRVPRRLPPNILSDAEVKRVFRCSLAGEHGLRDRAIVETFYATGIRRMELANLDLSDVDFGRGLVLVRRGKGGKDRRVPIARRAMRCIERYLDDSHRRRQGAAPLFLDRDGERFRLARLSDLVARLLRRAGIRASGACKVFRHTAASLMHENGADILHVKEMLGHADVSTTQIYVHVTMRTLREVYARTHPAARRAKKSKKTP